MVASALDRIGVSTSWWSEFLDALARALTRNVKITIYMSNPGAKAYKGTCRRTSSRNSGLG